MALRWYVVHAYSNFEHRVAESLKDRIKRAELDSKFGEILVPTEEVAYPTCCAASTGWRVSWRRRPAAEWQMPVAGRRH